jgi:hypothetical protein
MNGKAETAGGLEKWVTGGTSLFSLPLPLTPGQICPIMAVNERIGTPQKVATIRPAP